MVDLWPDIDTTLRNRGVEIPPITMLTDAIKNDLATTHALCDWKPALDDPQYWVVGGKPVRNTPITFDAFLKYFFAKDWVSENQEQYTAGMGFRLFNMLQVAPSGLQLRLHRLYFAGFNYNQADLSLLQGHTGKIAKTLAQRFPEVWAKQTIHRHETESQRTASFIVELAALEIAFRGAMLALFGDRTINLEVYHAAIVYIAQQLNIFVVRKGIDRVAMSSIHATDNFPAVAILPMTMCKIQLNCKRNNRQTKTQTNVIHELQAPFRLLWDDIIRLEQRYGAFLEVDVDKTPRDTVMEMATAIRREALYVGETVSKTLSEICNITWNEIEEWDRKHFTYVGVGLKVNICK